MDDWGSVLLRHRELDSILENLPQSREFISDWNCKHPFYKEALLSNNFSYDLQGYSYVRDNSELVQKIVSFHERADKCEYLDKEILISAGSTTLISSFFVWLKAKKISEVYYIPPLYHTFYFLAKIYDITLRPVTSDHLIQDSTKLNLPLKKTILLMTDPIWYAGYGVKKESLMIISEWQKSTESIIFLDGSFQYFKWDQTLTEYSVVFDKSLTMRLICPTKMIASHGFRFSYLLTPKDEYPLFNYILDNLLGSSSSFDLYCADKCMDILNSDSSNSKLVKYTYSRYKTLVSTSFIDTKIEANCGYFVFAKINKKYRYLFQTMDGTYFEQDRFKDYVRVNLLSEAVNKYLEETDLS